MRNRLFRIVFWSELAALELAVILFVLPLRFERTWLGASSNTMIEYYYTLSLVAIVISKMLYYGRIRD